jgi:hypothetical protein
VIVHDKPADCPPWCVSDHHGEGPGELDPVLHHYSKTTGGAGVLVDLEQADVAAPEVLLHTASDHHEVRLTPSQAGVLGLALLTWSREVAA